MTLGELIAIARDLLDDTNASAYLWSDNSLVAFANSAQKEACRRAPLLVDSTSEFCSLVVTKNTSIYDISPLIINIIRAKLVSQPTPLVKVQRTDLDTYIENWEAELGTPRYYLTDRTNTLQLYPTPVVDTILNLQVVRYPLVDLVATSDVPEIDEQYHFGLIDWICHLAYLKQDAETADLNKASSFYKFFTDKFGERPTAMTEVYRKVMPNNLRMQNQRFGG